MRVFLILFYKELKSIFLSPIAYVVLALVMALNGLAFSASIQILQQQPSNHSIVHWTFKPVWFYLLYFVIFPLITMRLFAEEQKLGTMETMLTAPVRTSQLLGAKYLAALFFYVAIWLPSLMNFYIFDWITVGEAQIPPGSLLGSYMVLFLMGAFNVAIGCFASALTKNQIIAAITCFALILAHFLLGFFMMIYAQQIPDKFLPLVRYIATSSHIEKFTAGLIDSRAIVYYITFALLYLGITFHVVEYRKWKV